MLFFAPNNLFAITKPGQPNCQKEGDYAGSANIGGVGGGPIRWGSTPKTKNIPRPKNIGPSGNFKRHTIKHSTRKAAKEGAKIKSKGQAPKKHYRNKQGQPHFHETDKNKKKKKDGPHHNFPK